MTIYRPGDVVPLVAQFYQYAGGPLVDVTNIQIKIQPVAGGAAILGPTSTGITHVTTGTYSYAYTVPANVTAGSYIVTWPNDENAAASEIIQLGDSATAAASYCDGWTPTFTCALPTGAYAVSGTALQAASEVLYGLSGRQFGLCTVTRRPCRQSCYGDTWPIATGTPLETYDNSYPTPALYAGEWYNITCGSCGSDCSCARVSEIALPGPVYDVTSVKIDGVVLTEGTDYRLDNSRYLVRLGGEEWPLCNDLNLADTEVGTWSVTYRTGQALPALGQLALGILTDEFTKALLCDASCRLPKPVQSLSRQGVNITFLDPNEVFQAGRTGLYTPDLFITTYNPRALTTRSRVYDIDNPQRLRSVT